jgi:hypothetical protein
MGEVIFKIINQFTKGVDTYHNNGSMWLIFTDEKKWVIELTKDGTLWYNFYFFQDCFKYLSLDVVKNQHYITEWVEGIIQNGVRETKRLWPWRKACVEDTIQNGIKETKSPGADGDLLSTIEWMESNNTKSVPKMIDNVIENGIKETHEDVYHNKGRVEGVIRNGIKETKSLEHDRTTYLGYFSQERGSHTPLDMVQDVIKNGIKETIELPDKSGELNGYGEYYARQKNMTYPHMDIINDVISDGIKETNWRKVDNHPTYLDHILIE